MQRPEDELGGYDIDADEMQRIIDSAPEPEHEYVYEDGKLVIYKKPSKEDAV